MSFKRVAVIHSFVRSMTWFPPNIDNVSSSIYDFLHAECDSWFKFNFKAIGNHQHVSATDYRYLFIFTFSEGNLACPKCIFHQEPNKLMAKFICLSALTFHLHEVITDILLEEWILSCLKHSKWLSVWAFLLTQGNSMLNHIKPKHRKQTKSISF